MFDCMLIIKHLLIAQNTDIQIRESLTILCCQKYNSFNFHVLYILLYDDFKYVIIYNILTSRHFVTMINKFSLHFSTTL